MNKVVDIKTPMFLPIKKAAEITGLSEYFFRQSIRAGKIPHLREGNKIFVNMPRLFEMLDDMTDNSIIKL